MSGAALSDHVKTTAESAMYRMNMAAAALDTRLARTAITLHTHDAALVRRRVRWQSILAHTYCYCV
jgi:hypothetical protein